VIIKRICFNNFGDFYGKHVLQLDRGINFVVGRCGTGRIYIFKALKFVFLADPNFPRDSLFNFWYRKECEKDHVLPFCEVEVEIEHKETSYALKGRLEYTDPETIKQTMSFNKNFDWIFRNELETILLSYDLPSRKEFENEPIETQMILAVRKQLRKNIDCGFKMAVIDQILTHLTAAKEKEMIGSLLELEMDQIIILNNYFPDHLNEYPLSVTKISEGKEAYRSVIERIL
jgi:hypothetical protein